MITEQLTDPDILTTMLADQPESESREFKQPTVPVIVGREERTVATRILNTTVLTTKTFIVAYTGSPRFKIAPANNPNNSK